MFFKDIGHGLYVYDPCSVEYNMNKPKFYNYSMLFQTIDDNKLKYSDRDAKRADRVMYLYHKLSRPSIQKFIYDIDNSAVLNCPFII